MRDAETGDKKSVGTGSYNGNKWIGPAILASYQELVEKVSPQKASTETLSDKSDNGEKAQPAKKEKKKSTKKKKSK